MTEYLQLVGLALIGGVASLSVGAVLLSRKDLAEKFAHYATPFAAGALLAAVFLDLLKEGVEMGSADSVLLAALIGMLLFFLGERGLRWFHHHHGHHDDKKQAEKSLIIVGDTVHNALDGVAIAAAFLVSPATGVVTTIAVAAHEIPQEVGDFGLLLSRGMSRVRVLLVNVLSSLATVVAAVIVYALGNSDVLPIGVLLGLSAGFLLYIAASDVIPEIHEHKPKRKWLDWQALLLLAGVLVVGLTINIAHRYIHHDHDRGHSHESSHHEHEDDHDHNDDHDEEDDD